MKMEDMVIISVDDHITEPPTVFDNQLSGEDYATAPKLKVAPDGANYWEYQGKRMRNVALNSVTGRVRAGSSVLDLVERLHPTHAVGGLPRAAAMALIRGVERMDRGWYAAPVGWVDAHGDGEFAVALRSGLVRGSASSIASRPRSHFSPNAPALTNMAKRIIPTRMGSARTWCTTSGMPTL